MHRAQRHLGEAWVRRRLLAPRVKDPPAGDPCREHQAFNYSPGGSGTICGRPFSETFPVSSGGDGAVSGKELWKPGGGRQRGTPFCPGTPTIMLFLGEQLSGSMEMTWTL